jgi:cell fate (sporulation/competence/biofilm development) regulator YlbF (YheA/YmcA/DUF963 family)
MVDIIWNDLEVSAREVVMQAARQFAQAFAETEQYRAFERAYDAFRQDAEAQNARLEFQKKYASLKALLMLNAVGDEDRQELNRLQDRFYQLPSVKHYAQAQEELIALAQEIGDFISSSIGLDFGNSCRTGGSCCG